MKRSIVSIGARSNPVANTPVSATGQTGAALANTHQTPHEPRRRSSHQAGYYTSGSAYAAHSRRSGFGARSSMFRIS